MKLSFGIVTLAAFTACAAMAQPLSGVWDAKVNVKGLEVPFRIEFSSQGSNVTAWFFNGDEKVISTVGKIENGSLFVKWDQYGSTLTATLKDGALSGKYDRRVRGLYAFEAKPAQAVPPPKGEIPSIAGEWVIPTTSANGESAWRFIVRQTGPEVSAAILRVDGDTGVLSGSYRDGEFLLSHFDGARPSVYKVTPQPDGTLAIVQNGKDHLFATRLTEARAKGLPEPSDPFHHTSMRDPSEPFRFSFPDLTGRIVSNSDERFRGKVVIVVISGSWCPNCHDEAPVLEELYHKYRSRGLEVVALSFEEEEQLKNPTRVRAFIKEFGIDYPVLLCGQTEELKDKIPQAVHLDSFPTSFYLGRDGRVRAVHAGFAGKATGDAYHIQEKEVTSLLENLLSEDRESARAFR